MVVVRVAFEACGTKDVPSRYRVVANLG